MGRELRRVPLDFQYPLHEVWYGELVKLIETCKTGAHKDRCNECKRCAEILGVPKCEIDCPDWEMYLKEPLQKLEQLLSVPKGEGYQLWETTSEGSPISPVFKTLEELCEYAEHNCSVFGSVMATKEEWKQMLESNFVYHKIPGAILF